MVSAVLPVVFLIAFQAPPGPDGRGDKITSPVEQTTNKVAINIATATELQGLPGIGPKMAGRILLARKRRPFRRPSDLRRVNGIGRKTARRLAPLVDFRQRVH